MVFGKVNVTAPLDAGKLRVERLVLVPVMNWLVVAVARWTGAEKALLDTIGFVVVPATAGHVKVAVPLVDPKPVSTQAVVFRTPQLCALKSPIPGVVPPIVGGDARLINELLAG